MAEAQEVLSAEDQHEAASLMAGLKDMLPQEQMKEITDAGTTEPAEQPPAMSPEAKSLGSAMQKSAGQTQGEQPPASQDPATDPNVVVDPAQSAEPTVEGQPKPEEFAPEVKDQKEQSTIKIKSDIFGDNEVEFGGKKAEELSFTEVPQDINDYAKKNFGVDKLETLMSSASKWRTDSQELVKFQEENGKFHKLFKDLPDEMYNAIMEHSKGNDWKQSIVSSNNIDYTKNVDSVTQQDLVNEYFPNQFSSEDWDAYRDSDHENHGAIKKAIDIANTQSRTNFLNQQNNLQTKRAGYLEVAEKQEKELASSLVSSAKHLRSSFPQPLSDSYVDNISSEMKSDGLNKMFYDANGNLKEDALLRYTLARDGFDLFQQLEGKITNQAKTEERQEMLERTPDTVQKRGSEAPQVNKGVEKMLAEINSLEPKYTF